MKQIIIVFFFVLFTITGIQAKPFDLKSPDGNLKLHLKVDTTISIILEHKDNQLISFPKLSLNLIGGEILGINPKISKSQFKSNSKIIPTFHHRQKTVSDHYNELTILFKGEYGIIFRVYNDGIVYRFTTNRKETLYIENESVVFDFGSDRSAWVSYSNGKEENRFKNSFQNVYLYEKISAFNPKNIAFLPTLVDLDNNLKACIIEADLENYPGMFLQKGKAPHSYEGVFCKYPKTEMRTPTRQQQLISESEPYIAKTAGKRDFPWRGVVISTADTQLANNDMVYRLGAPSRVKETSWIKPGKAAWDWWNDWGLHGVDFKAGINNETYKYYIDFASENGLEYVILDEGWSPPKEGNIMQIVPEINLTELIDYAHRKKVNLILWAVWNVLDDKLEEACKYYSSIGIKGFKIDFMDRDDQKAVNFIYRCADMCAKYQLIIDYHGIYKPTGIQRTYPNIINYEGVFGMEELKWSKPDMPLYDVTFPFIRMLAGPVDYTAGAMRNANKQNFRDVYYEPMSQGTRCHQLASYIVFDAPFSMLSDSPSNYRKEQECTDFISAIPTVFDSTMILDGKVSEYIVTARRKGNTYYMGALSNWDSRKLQVNLQFLPEGNYKAIVFQDGVNANKVAVDYKKIELSVNNKTQLNLDLAKGGGWACIITK